MKKFILTFALILICMMIIFTTEFIQKNSGKLHIVVCDVGQGDAIFITTPTKAQILIDGGPDKAVLNCLARNMPFWDRSINAVIMTHPDADHMFGLIDVVDRYNLNSFYTKNIKTDSEALEVLEAKLASKKLSAKDLSAGDVLRDSSGAKIIVLSPRLSQTSEPDHNISSEDRNALSVVALLTYGNFSILLTGDAEKEVMEEISDEAGNIDVLKVPHHGSKNGMTDGFLKLVNPGLALISVGGKNRYGHPAQESLTLLDKNKVKVFRTDISGEIEIVSDGKSYSVKTEN